MTPSSRQVLVKGEFEGLHHWPDAPEEVAFLRNPHRHVFYVEVSFEVTHNNRALEFFIIKKKLHEIIAGNTGMIYALERAPSMSCEMIAQGICDRFQAWFDLKPCRVKVSEDGENAAELFFNVKES